ncbi:MAG: HD domain-containing phosphohydrolase [Elusimicrobiota bacterium]
MKNTNIRTILYLLISVLAGVALFYVMYNSGLTAHFSAVLSLVFVALCSFIVMLKFLRPFSKFQILIDKISSGYLKMSIDTSDASTLESIGDSINRAITGFKSLIDISQLLSKETNLDNLLNLIISETTKLMEAERTTLFFYNSELKELWSYIAQELEIKEIRLPLGKGVAGYVARTGKLINIPDAYRDPHFDRSADKVTGFTTKSILCTPMFNHKGEMLGVIQVLNKKEGIFSTYDESLLTALAAQAAIAIENTRLYESQEYMFKNFIKTIAAVVDARDPVTMGHSDRVAKYSSAIGKAMGLSGGQMKMLEYAAILHDVGKVSIPDAILLKPGSFTPEEYEIIKEHAVHTRDILSNIYSSSELREIPVIASSHHEKMDGSGYPYGLKQDEIPSLAKIICVVDIFDALVSYDRPYKRAFPLEKALEIIQNDSAAGKFDRDIVKLFVEKKLYEIERREYVRISAEFTMEFRKVGPQEWKEILPVITQTRDISGGGILFETETEVDVGNYLEVKLHIRRFTVNVIARVVRKELVNGKKRVGIMFINLSNDFKKRLSNYLVDIKEEVSSAK